jgi:homoserine O-acetyltransferase/O-succinyltransferase
MNEPKWMINFVLAILFLLNKVEASEMPLQNEHTYIFPAYAFRNGEKLDQVKLHYATLGNPKRDQDGKIVNAILILHWTGGDSSHMLSDAFKSALYAPGKPFDANKYFLIFPDSIGHGKSSKPSDGLKANFPHYGYLDMVDLQHKLVVEELGITHLKYILGTSMGGMHAWLWSILYPAFMDGAMPIVSLPERVKGRNLLWRQLVIKAIRNDPGWQEGNYTKQPYSLFASWPFARMLLDGVPHMQRIVTDGKTAAAFIHEGINEAAVKDANDLIYTLEASADYDPEPQLKSIETKVFALDFTDDQLDPIELGTLQRLIKQVKNGRAVIQQGTNESYGHLTMAHPNLWSKQVEEFIHFVENN